MTTLSNLDAATAKRIFQEAVKNENDVDLPDGIPIDRQTFANAIDDTFAKNIADGGMFAFKALQGLVTKDPLYQQGYVAAIKFPLEDLEYVTAVSNLIGDFAGKKSWQDYNIPCLVSGSKKTLRVTYNGMAALKAMSNDLSVTQFFTQEVNKKTNSIMFGPADEKIVEAELTSDNKCLVGGLTTGEAVDMLATSAKNYTSWDVLNDVIVEEDGKSYVLLMGVTVGPDIPSATELKWYLEKIGVL